MQLSDKVALVTGGTLGIGAAIALQLARIGANIAVVARNLGEPANSLGRQIKALGRQFHALQLDMSREADCATSVEQTIQHFGRLDVLVLNAGGSSPGKIEDISSDQWRQTMAVHVDALFYGCKAALPHMKQQQEGVIITIASSAAIRGVPGALAYATAKGAVPQFTRCLARDVADYNIRVNCVAPGVIRTRFHDDMPPERKKINLEQRIPLHREGTAEQVADVVGMLVTNDYITGETIVIDGGLTSRIA